MVRIQMARDLSMAATAAAALREAGPQQTVLLLAGAARPRDRGIPLHLASSEPVPALHVVMFSGSPTAWWPTSAARPCSRRRRTIAPS